jgi:secondary thiamine-phosphate synthase enzyme
VTSFEVRTGGRAQMVDITGQVQQALGECGIRDGACMVYVPHTTAGVTINENADPSVVTDILAGLERMVPRDAGYRHREGNADAHIKATLTGFSQTIPVRDGRLVLGTWQGIFFCEFDGPRTRTVMVSALPAGV